MLVMLIGGGEVNYANKKHLQWTAHRSDPGCRQTVGGNCLCENHQPISKAGKKKHIHKAGKIIWKKKKKKKKKLHRSQKTQIQSNNNDLMSIKSLLNGNYVWLRLDSKKKKAEDRRVDIKRIKVEEME